MIAWRGIRMTVLLAALFSACVAQAVEVAGVRVDDKVQVDGTELLLNGAGLRSKFFVKVYVGALYAAQRATTPEAIYDSPAPRRKLMRFLREMDAGSFSKALDEGLQNNLTAAEFTVLKPQVEQMGAIMSGIGKVREGDIIVIDFTMTGVEIGLNNQSRGKVASPAFGRALLKVWLGENPADASLKKALLGG
jgi:long-chain acyl-CoA synthetase